MHLQHGRRSIVIALAAALLAGPTVAQQRRARRPAPPPAPLPAAPRRPSAAAPIPTPRSVLGFDPGDDRKLVEWPVLVRYFETLPKPDPRREYRERGKDALGAP